MKIISFSLWGDSPKYCVGAIKNAQIARDLYPDWTCRFYCSALTSPVEVLRELYSVDGDDVSTSKVSSYDIGFPAVMHTTPKKRIQLVIAPMRDGWKMMFDRFQAASDLECEVMISRDCDSRLSLREKLAVDEWLSSKRTWHIMRDHPWHGSLMLGGMWGVKGCPAMSDWIASWKQEDRYQTDQDFLQSMVYPIASKDAMIHASFCAIEPEARPFPSPRSGLEFVGQVFDENDITVAEHQTMLMKALNK